MKTPIYIKIEYKRGCEYATQIIEESKYNIIKNKLVKLGYKVKTVSPPKSSKTEEGQYGTNTGTLLKEIRNR